MEYSKSLMTALKKAEQIAAETGGTLGSEHLILGLLSVEKCSASQMMVAFGVSPDCITKYLVRRPIVGEVYASQRTSRMIEQAAALAGSLNKEFIGSEHLLFAILEDRSCYGVAYLQQNGINVSGLTNAVAEYIYSHSGSPADQMGHEPELGRDIPRGRPTTASIDDLFGGGEKQQHSNLGDIFGKAERPAGSASAEGKKSNLGELLQYGVDLTQKAKDGKLDPVIGRETEIERVIQCLCRKTKNNPVLIGEAGVGKTAVVEGLAQQIAEDKVPDMLRGKTIFSLDIGSLVAGTKYRGEFEERITMLLNKLKASPDVILFLDELHNILNAGGGSDGSLGAGEILKPALSRGEICTIGATTISEYRKYVEKDKAFERRFMPIIVEQPSVDETIQILKGLRAKYEKHHKVTITDEAIEAAVKLSDRYIYDRFQPDKSIDLIDEAASRKRVFAFALPPTVEALEKRIVEIESDLKMAEEAGNTSVVNELRAELERYKALDKEKDRYEEIRNDVKLSIGATDINEIVCSKTGIPITRISEAESKKLLGLEDELKQRIVGQDNAVTAVATAVRRARAGLQDPKKPLGSFIFLGPTGVGKTELAKSLAEMVFGSEQHLIRFDMSEYMEKATVSRLIGAAPGYVGYEEGGQLTDRVRSKPYSVVLFDEIEKAHPDVFNLFLQILDDGRLTDSQGRTVSFKNTIIIMTSNIGSSDISKMAKLGFGTVEDDSNYESMKEKQMEALKKAMRPEFINRIGDIIIFRKLDKHDVRNIADIMIKNTTKKLNNLNIDIEITDAAKDFLVEKGFNAEYGARPLKATIQKLVEDKLSEEIIKGELVVGEKVQVDFDGTALTFGGFKE